MGFSLNTNISAMTANLHLTLKNEGLNSSLDRLASGSNISNAANDTSGLTIANQLSAQVSGLGQSIQNANNSIGMIQIADGAMSGIQENMDRIRVLTLQASNGIMNAGNRASIQKEIDGLLKSSDNIAKETSYNGIKLLDGSSGNGTFSTQSFSIDLTTSAGLTSALEDIDFSSKAISEIRSELGSSQNQLMSEIRNTSVTQINVASAESQIRDVDFALESANFSKANFMLQVGSFAQTQANTSAENVTRLFS